MQPIIRTSRLDIRRLRRGDLDDLARLYADPDVRRHFPEGILTREATAEELEWFVHGENDGFPDIALWATIDRETGRFIGRCGLLRWQIDGRAETEIAYLLDRSVWGRGLGSEAARALVAYGFGRLRLPRLIALVAPENTASIRTAEAAGLRFERLWHNGTGPVRIYAIANPALPTIGDATPSTS